MEPSLLCFSSAPTCFERAEGPRGRDQGHLTPTSGLLAQRWHTVNPSPAVLRTGHLSSPEPGAEKPSGWAATVISCSLPTGSHFSQASQPSFSGGLWAYLTDEESVVTQMVTVYGLKKLLPLPPSVPSLALEPDVNL